MYTRVMRFLRSLFRESPIRIFSRFVLARMGCSAEVRSRWGIAEYPAYLLGLFAAAQEAVLQGETEISVCEFGVAGGNGLIAMESSLKLLSDPSSRMLNRCILYFDDIMEPHCHRFAGELLAIDEFNQKNEHVKIDRWRGLAGRMVFRDQQWIRQMYIAHHLAALSSCQPDRDVDQESLKLTAGA